MNHRLCRGVYTHMNETNKQPVLGIGACVYGQRVRYNGESKRAQPLMRRVDTHFELRPFCPEVAIGLGVPREPIRLVGDAEDGSVRAMDSDSQTKDYTDQLESHAAKVLEQNPDLCGYILVKGSPSCGWERVKRYNQDGHSVASDSRGVFAQAMHSIDPLLPLEDDGRLNDPGLRESFFCRAYAYASWKSLLANGLSKASLLEFYSEHKYLVMAHHYESYRRIGRLLADLKADRLETIADEFITLLMTALSKPASRHSHSNALMHVMGYLKRCISSEERQEMRALIEDYRQGVVPLVVPVTLLKHHFARHDVPYMARQNFLSPYPEQLQLRNQL